MGLDRSHDLHALLRALGRLDGDRAGSCASDPERDLERSRLVERLPTDVARLYDRLLASGRRPTVVEAGDGHCAGCHMRVPPALMQQLTRAQELCRCPSCHRFLSPPALDRSDRASDA